MITEWMRRFAVRGVFWRQYLDWALFNVPFYFLPLLIWFWTSFFFFLRHQRGVPFFRTLR